VQLDYHDLRHLKCYAPNIASLPVRQFNDAVNFATSVVNVSFLRNCSLLTMHFHIQRCLKPDERKTTLFALTTDEGCRSAHPH
jgi:hypothetical protein